MSRKKILFFSFLILSILYFQTIAVADEVTAKSGIVVTAHQLASEMGIEILKAGGNAIDAAVAASFVIGVVEPNASGLGGGGAMSIYLSKPDSLTYINFYQCAPQNFPDDFNSRREDSSARSVLVPGTVAGLYHALSKYGSFSWNEILNKVIEKVESGFAVNENLQKIIFDSYEKLLKYPATKSIYLPNDLPPEIGDTIKNEAIVQTLKKLAQGGSDVFYKGEIADSIETVMMKYGGVITRSDLMSYKIRESKPLNSQYRDYKIFSAPPPQSGMTVMEVLNILEIKNLSEMGDFSGNSSIFHFMAETFKRADTDRSEYLGDPAFSDIPVNVLLSKEFALSRFQTIDPNKVVPFNLKEKPASSFLKNTNDKFDDRDGSTTHISIIDAEGNAVSLTQTLNYYWGSGICVCGFLLNNGMTSFSSESEKVNRAESFKQPRTTIAPTILFKEGKLFMVIGSPGAGRIISTLVQVICNVVDFNKSAGEANDAARFHSRRMNERTTVEARFPQKLLEDLESMGHQFQVMGEMDSFFGGVQFIIVDQKNHILIGSADPRRSGVTIGY